MKKIVLFILICTSTTGLFAQIEVTNSTFPALGDTLFTITAVNPNGILPGDSGAEIIWDFSTLTGGFNNETIYQDAANGSAAADVPNADLFTDVFGAETYFEKTDTEFSILAGKGTDPTGFGVEALVKFMPPIIERRAPMNFGDVNSSESNASFAFGSEVIPDTLLDAFPIVPDSIRIRINQDRTDVVDAFGMATIPGGTFEVLREKRTQTRSTRVDILLGFLGWQDVTDLITGIVGVDAGLGEISTVNYLYFSNEEKEIIVNISADETGETVTGVTYKFIDIVDNVDNIVFDNSQVTAYPNPVSAAINLKFSGIETGNYTLIIQDILGKTIWQKGYFLNNDQTVRVDVNDFQNGTYVYSILNEKGEILQSEQFSVVRSF